MSFFEELSSGRPLFFDGAMGTQLQAAGLSAGELSERWVLTKPESILRIHAAYRAAGADIIKTCTFGNNAGKLEKSGLDPETVARAAVRLAKEALLAREGSKGYVAYDVGPLGRLLRPLGDLPFEEAVELFKAPIKAGAEAGADLILLETFTDAYELKAAVLAAKESCALPIVATVTPDASGRLLTGADMEGVVALLEGLRVDALGINCSRGPEALLPSLRRMLACSSLPIVFNPNAGLPRTVQGKTIYDLDPASFAAHMKEAALAGARLLGGCCGTTPAHIRALYEACAEFPPMPAHKKKRTLVSGCGRTVCLDDALTLIGERINPTGKPKMKEALRNGEYDAILREAVKQQECGVQALDVNAGLPEIDEAAVLPLLVEKLQGICELPLQLDSANAEALARAMRIYNGKPLVNSVNAKQSSMDAVFPLVQKYGGTLVALTLDENGIPETPQERAELAGRIIREAAKYGIEPKDILVDTLTMTMGADAQNPARTLEALRMVRENYGTHAILGVSNVSFGLPGRELLNSAFFTMAAAAGLSAAIVNPFSQSMMDAYRAACALTGKTEGIDCFIAAYADTNAAQKADAGEISLDLGECVLRGLSGEAAVLAKRAKDEGGEALALIQEKIIPALNRAGEAYEGGKLFLPGLLMCAEAAKAALGVLCPEGESGGDKGEVVLATVQGDVHDIGKNIAKSMLQSYRFHVTDLGRDVAPELVAKAAVEKNAKLVGLSALMTTTVPAMEKTIELIRKALPQCKVMVGGAVLSEDYAQKIGADRFVPDAMASVRAAQEVYGVN